MGFAEDPADAVAHRNGGEVQTLGRLGDRKQGARVLGDGQPKIGAHGKPVLFLHPKDFCGTLVELEQA